MIYSNTLYLKDRLRPGSIEHNSVVPEVKIPFMNDDGQNEFEPFIFHAFVGKSKGGILSAIFIHNVEA